MKILLTGFEPFDGSHLNPSALVVKIFPEDQFSNHIFVKMILPVDSSSAVDLVRKSLSEFQPDLVLHLGEASRRPVISLEKVAINWMDFRIADNAGAQIKDQKIVEDGPTAYFSSLPLTKIQTNLRSAAIPVEISLSAGAYLCNQVFYSSLHFINQTKLSTMSGFIHLPSLPAQVVEKNQNFPSMSKELSLEAIQITIKTCLNYMENV